MINKLFITMLFISLSCYFYITFNSLFILFISGYFFELGHCIIFVHSIVRNFCKCCSLMVGMNIVCLFYSFLLHASRTLRSMIIVLFNFRMGIRTYLRDVTDFTLIHACWKIYVTKLKLLIKIIIIAYGLYLVFYILTLKIILILNLMI